MTANHSVEVRRDVRSQFIEVILRLDDEEVRRLERDAFEHWLDERLQSLRDGCRIAWHEVHDR